MTEDAATDGRTDPAARAAPVEAGRSSRGYPWPGDADPTAVPADLRALALAASSDVDAVEAAAEAAYLPRAGGAVAGDLAVGGYMTVDADVMVVGSVVAPSPPAEGFHLANRQYVDGGLAAKADVTSTVQALDAKADKATAITGTGGLTGGGTLAAARALSIADGGVTEAKIGTGAVTSAKILDGTIATGDLADGAVTSAKIADGTITNDDVSATAAIAVSKVSGAVASATVGNLLTENMATGTDALGTTAGVVVTAGTVESSTEWSASGTRSIKAVTGATGGAGFIASYNIPVVAGERYTGGGTFRPTVGANSAPRLRIWWHKADGSPTTPASSDLSGVAVQVGEATTYSRTVTAPAGAVYCTVMLGCFPTASVQGDTYYADNLFFVRGEGGTYAPPGRQVPALGAVPATIVSSTSKVSLDRAVGIYRLSPAAGQAINAEPQGAAFQTGAVITVVNAGAGSVSLTNTTVGAPALPGKGFVRIYSDGASWWVLDGRYTDESVGRRIYTWDAVNSRWQMTFGDTGLRDVASLLTDGFVTHATDGYAHLRRQGSTVTLSLRIYAGGRTGDNILTLPSGFRPPRYVYGWASTAASNPAFKAITVGPSTSGGVTTAAGQVTNEGNAYFTWTTSDAWPTALPGTAVDTIPTGLSADDEVPADE